LANINGWGDLSRLPTRRFVKWLNQEYTMSDVKKFECEIVETDNYLEVISLKTIKSLPNQVDFSIFTQLSTSKKPQERRVKSASIIDRKKLQELHLLIGDFLRSSSGDPDNINN